MFSKKEDNLKNVYIAIPADHREKIKGNEKRDKLLEPWQRQTLEKIKVTMRPVVLSGFRMIPKRLVRELEKFDFWGGAESISGTALLRSSRRQDVWRLEETHCYSDSNERLP